ncbi:MAG: DUF5009 domain-containing protein [Planctomycetota bacterium]
MTEQPTSDEKQPAPADRRAHGLDALRGLAILLMCLSGILPGELPNWMYHGYYPTSLPAALIEAEATPSATPGGDLGPWEAVPQKRFRADWPSLTWVDAVFPMFLFAMGAAIPLAIDARRARNESWRQQVRGAFTRFGLLVGFAVYVKHVTPYFMANPPGVATWAIALLAMVPVGLVLTRLPRRWPRGLVWALRSAGWAGANALVAWTHARSGKPFTWDDKDIIILLLAWSSLLVTLAVLVAGRWRWLRLALVLPVALLAHHQAMRPGWRVLGDRLDPWMDRLQRPKQWLDRSDWAGQLPGGFEVPGAWLDFSSLYDFTWFKFAVIVVLGTFVGDVLWKRRSAEFTSGGGVRRGVGRDLALTALLLGAVVGTFIGLKDYATTFLALGPVSLTSPYAALMFGGAPAGLAVWVAGRSGETTEDRRYLATLTRWGAAVLGVGLVLAVLPGPALDTAFGFFEGGVKKGPPATLSWYLASLGASVLLLAAFAVWLDVRRLTWPWNWLIANGQNPMLAYLGIRNLLAPLVALPVFWWSADPGMRSLNGVMLERVFGGGPWEAAAWAGVQTLGLALVVWGLTRRGVVWRS